MSIIEETGQFDPKSGFFKSRDIRIDEYYHSHFNLGIQMFASKESDVEFSDHLISMVDKKAKSLMKSATRMTVKLVFRPITYLISFHDPQVTVD
tara:strand:+ start:155 stop:436 length:282 start_codon:yes stop_codon:yes gene_type:complete